MAHLCAYINIPPTVKYKATEVGILELAATA